MKASPVVIAAAVVLTGCGGTTERGGVLTLRGVEAAVRSVGLTYIVLPGTAIVQANSRGQNPSVWVFISIFRSSSAVGKSPVIAQADKYFPRAHSKDITVCNVWLSPY